MFRSGSELPRSSQVVRDSLVSEPADAAAAVWGNFIETKSRSVQLCCDRGNSSATGVLCQVELIRSRSADQAGSVALARIERRSRQWT